ncbi:hypothetical protein H072_5396 [Dactylellina haptotyla CBS 200.50]|uniref:Uncharacterized protein n=1 Tax=Dactylellina haptotyla (strain CBS 200.50) TaxID=1284197 RepID=S8BZE8_DACHA|nr:hypothetical protein H072_5396 [Dactylellina haptotyla CBS 200.50]
MPAFAGSPAVGQILQTLTDINNRLDNIENSLATIQTRQNMTLIQLSNSSASRHAPLRFPAGLNVTNLPATPGQLMVFSSKLFLYQF